MAFTPIDPTKAEVRNTGTPTDPVFEFYFPQGPKGDAGGFTYGTVLGTSNLNDIVVPGIYVQRDSSGNSSGPLRNYPLPVGGYGTVLVYATSVADVIQKFYPQYYTNAYDGRNFYQRNRSNGVWSPWRAHNSTRVDQTAGRAIYQWDELNGREQIIFGDTGWRDMWNAVLAIDPAATKKPGFLGVRIRRTLQHVHLDVGFNTALANTIDWRPAILPSVNWYPDIPVNQQMSAAQTGSAGVIHFSPVNYIKNWTAGDVVLQLSLPCSQPWPTSLPGIPSATNGTIPNT